MKLSETVKGRQLENQIIFTKYNSGAKYIPVNPPRPSAEAL